LGKAVAVLVAGRIVAVVVEVEVVGRLD